MLQLADMQIWLDAMFFFQNASKKEGFATANGENIGTAVTVPSVNDQDTVTVGKALWQGGTTPETNCTCDCPEDVTETFGSTGVAETTDQSSQSPEMTENQPLEAFNSQPTEGFLSHNGPSLEQIDTTPSKNSASSSGQGSTSNTNIESVEESQEKKWTVEPADRAIIGSESGAPTFIQTWDGNIFEVTKIGRFILWKPVTVLPATTESPFDVQKRGRINFLKHKKESYPKEFQPADDEK